MPRPGMSFLLSYTTIHVVLFAIVYSAWAESRMYIRVARCSAGFIYSNLWLLLFSMMRTAIARIRASYTSNQTTYKIMSWIGMESHIHVHQFAGQMMFLATLVHVSSYVYGAISRGRSVVQLLAYYQSWGSLTFICFALLWLCAQEWVKRKKFEWFYYTHYLMIVIGIGLFYHAPRFYLVMALPLLGYMADRCWRWSYSFYPQQVVGCKQHPENVLELTISKPTRFAFRWQPGDYVFVCFPDVSRFQFHPFSIAFDDTKNNTFTIFLRMKGDWTQDLSKIMKPHLIMHDTKPFQSLTNIAKAVQSEFEVKEAPKGNVNPLVYLDGPISSKCSSLSTVYLSSLRHNSNKHLILIAEEMGITPYLAFLKQWSEQGPTQKNSIHVYWIARKAGTFKFASTMLNSCPVYMHYILKTDKMDTVDFWLQKFESHVTYLSCTKNKNTTVFYCGSRAFESNLREAAREWCKFEYISEHE